MTQQGAIPPDLWELIDQKIDRKVAALARSGMLRNASISEGGSLTINGGQFLVNYREADGGGAGVFAGDLYSAGVYVGTGFLVQTPTGVDMFMARQDVTFGGPRVELYDGGNRIIVSNDAASGQGLARPYIPGTFHPTRYQDMTVSTTSGTFETLFAATMYKQHPRIAVGLTATMDTAATTGEIKVLVNGAQLGSTAAVSFLVQGHAFGAAAVAGDHMTQLSIEIQGQRTSASGALRVQPTYLVGLQT